MLHSYVKMFVHLVWTTKNREKLLLREGRLPVQKHIAQYASDNDIRLDALNVQSDHVHAVVSLLSNQRVDDIVKLFKGE